MKIIDLGRLLPTHVPSHSLADLSVRIWEVWRCGRGTS